MADDGILEATTLAKVGSVVASDIAVVLVVAVFGALTTGRNDGKVAMDGSVVVAVGYIIIGCNGGYCTGGM